MGASQTDPPPQSRVAYVLSPALLRAADALPANAGRSRLVHTLAWHCGLIGTPALGAEAAAADVGDVSEEQELVRLLAGDADAADSTGPSHQDVSVAALRVPPMGTRKDLLAYHASSFVDVLLKEDASASGTEEGLDEVRLTSDA